jgi:hypothetical protein
MVRTTLPPPRVLAEPPPGTTRFEFTSDADPDGELRKALAYRRLSAFDVTLSGVVPADRAARLVRGTTPFGKRAQSETHQAAAVRKTLGCEVCRSPAVPEGLCDGCRRRLSMALVDPEAAMEAAARYRAEHPRPGTAAPAPTSAPGTRPGARTVPDLVVVDDDEGAESAAQMAAAS